MINIHKISFNTNSTKLVWSIYRNLKDQIRFKKHKGKEKIIAVLFYIKENFEELKKQQTEIKTIQNFESEYKIDYPKKYSEFEVQANLYAVLKFSYKLDVRGEVAIGQGSGKSRFDLVVFKDKKAVCIIEVKNQKREGLNTNTKQYKKYSSFGLRLFYCLNMSFVKPLAEEVLEFYKNTDPESSIKSMFDNI